MFISGIRLTKPLVQRAFAWEMCLEKFHLVTEDAATLQINVFCMGWHERNGQKLHVRLLRGTAGFAVVATFASRHHIVPGILPLLA